MKHSFDISKIKDTPILDVAERLGVELVGSGSQYAMKDPFDGGETSLQVDVNGNRWKRFSGITQGGVDGGSVLDLVMHVTDNSNFRDALVWFANNFPDRV
jgi:hypothetical protein